MRIWPASMVGKKSRPTRKGSGALMATKASDVPALARTELAFALRSVTAAKVGGSPAVLVTYQANSQPNAVTGKQYRLDVLRYELARTGEVVALTLSSPVGADNVDPWRTVTESFAWR